MTDDTLIQQVEAILNDLKAGDTSAVERLSTLVSSQIKVGNITDSTAVAIGHNIQMVVNQQTFPEDLGEQLQAFLKMFSPYLGIEDEQTLPLTRLGDIHGLSPVELQQQLNLHQSRLNRLGKHESSLLPAALITLHFKDFDHALMWLAELSTVSPTHAYGWYLYGIAEFRGKPPRLLNRDQALTIRSRLEKAIEFDRSQAHAALLLAVLNQEYFEKKGFHSKPPLSACLEVAKQGKTTEQEITALFDLVPIANNKLFKFS